jgi:hypothetical protein
LMLNGLDRSSIPGRLAGLSIFYTIVYRLRPILYHILYQHVAVRFQPPHSFIAFAARRHCIDLKSHGLSLAVV